MYKALDYAAQGKYKIIYVAPERLETMSFMTFAQKADISMVTIDEAHCISQWGQDFRPSYLKIVDFIDSLPERPVVSAFTATATSEVKTDIECILKLKSPKLVVTGFDRKNLYYSVEHLSGKKKDAYIAAYIKEHMDESGNWDNLSFENAVKYLVKEKNPLIESLINKLEDDKNLRNLLYNVLFLGQKISYNIDNVVIENAAMYGFISNKNDCVSVANRIFETRIYNWFISQEATDSRMYSEGVNDKNQFIQGNQLNMEKILEKFILHFNDIYGSQPDKFKEEDGRKLFLLYLRPIINGTGNYYIEAQTRDQKRTDVIVDYLGKQYIVELKIWRGEEYNTEGEKQIAEYLDYYHLDKGYLLSFNFNKNKQPGMKIIQVNGKTVVEAVV